VQGSDGVLSEIKNKMYLGIKRRKVKVVVTSHSWRSLDREDRPVMHAFTSSWETEKRNQTTLALEFQTTSSCSNEQELE
jgi:hypothetical protein